LKTRHTLLYIALLFLALLSTPGLAGEHTIGAGVHYWRAIDNVDDLEGIEDDGLSYLASYQYIPRGFFKFQIDLEIFEDGFGGSTDTAFAPQVFILAGKSIYAGLGVAVTISDDNDVSDPYFLGKIGWNLALIGSLDLDINATYHFNDWEAVGDFDLGQDSFTLGAVIRIGL
jgi:hypothetical protein